MRGARGRWGADTTDRRMESTSGGSQGDMQSKVGRVPAPAREAGGPVAHLMARRAITPYPRAIPPQPRRAMYPLLLLALLAAPQPQTPDSLDFRVWNHGRPAGEMWIVTTGDSARVHYRHVDRQRGPLVEASYRVEGGRLVWGEVQMGGAQEASADISGAPVQLRSTYFEVRDGTVRTWADGDTTAAAIPPGAWYIPPNASKSC